MALTDDLVAYYKFDGDADDAHTGGNDGSAVGATYTASGKINGAYSFDGNDYISAPRIDTSSGKLSIFMWLNLSNTTTVHVICSQRTNPTGDDFQWFTQSTDRTNSTVLLWGSSTILAYSGTGYWETGWHYYGITFDGTDLIFYKDGSSFSTMSQANTLANTAGTTLRIGYDAYSTYLVGKIDEVGIWDRALTSTEVSALYNSGDGLAYPFLAIAQNYLKPRARDRFLMFNVSERVN